MDLAIFLMALSSWAMEYICAQDTVVDYTGYQVYRVRPSSTTTMNILWKQIEESRLGLDLWGDYPLRGEIDVLVPPISKTKFQALLNSLSTSYNITVNDVQRLIDIERSSMQTPRPRHIQRRRYRRQSTSARSTGSGPRLTNELPLPAPSDEAVFYDNTIVGRIANLTEINNWLAAAENLFPDIVNVSSYGHSSEGRPLKCAKIARPSPDGAPKRAILIDAATHPREWITPPSVAYVMLQLINLWWEETELSHLLREYDWYLVPVANVDGFEFTRTDRLWRKTRSQHPYNPDCIGADMNRNFGFHWRNETYRPCTNHLYAGHGPFSEPEVRALADLMLSVQGRLHIYLNLHAPHELWLTPWAWTRDRPEDYEDIMSAGNASARAILESHGLTFLVGSPGEIFPRLRFFGTAMDYAKGVAGAKFSFAPELRRTRGVLIQNRTSIRECSEETWAAVVALLREIRRQDIRDGVISPSSMVEAVSEDDSVLPVIQRSSKVAALRQPSMDDAAAAIVDFLHHQGPGVGAGAVDVRSRPGDPVEVSPQDPAPDNAVPGISQTVTYAEDNEEPTAVEPELPEPTNGTVLADLEDGK